jgi:hypothetical protein
MGRRRGQVLLVFVGALPALLGLVGLAVDGGFYFATQRAAQFGSLAAARAAAVDVMLAQQGQQQYYAQAGRDGEALGKANVSPLRLSDAKFTLDYHNSYKCPENDGAWYGPNATASTRCVRATVSGSYPTLFMRILGLPKIDLQKMGFQPVSIVRIGGVLPLGVCKSEYDAWPAGPWVIWDWGANLCGVDDWEGLVDLDNSRPSCLEYWSWMLPEPPSGPPPKRGDPVGVETSTWCPLISFWIGLYTDKKGSIPIVDTRAGNTVVGCIKVTLDPRVGSVRATPQAGQAGVCGLPEQLQ